MKVLIVGGGLSGICLAHALEDCAVQFKIIDKEINHSTSVAAGMINPMTFRRMIKTWRGDELIPALNKFYPDLEQKIGHSFFYPIKLRRVFSSNDERNFWNEKLNDSAYSNYLNAIENQENTPEYINNICGSAFVNTPGYVDTNRFMKYNHNYFLEKGILKYETFQQNKLDKDNLCYQGTSYTHIIFAEGFVGENNPLFAYLPFKNAKGETLTVRSDVLRKDEIINRKCFVLPTKNGNYKLGSTYTWNTQDPSPTEAAKTELLSLYKQLSDAPVKVINHEAGIRPTSADRRPMIGEHPKHKGIHIFNGLGAKGFMIAPYFASHFINYLQGKCELDKEVDIQRFYKKFYPEQ